jgi:hypothetical protein
LLIIAIRKENNVFEIPIAQKIKKSTGFGLIKNGLIV